MNRLVLGVIAPLTLLASCTMEVGNSVDSEPELGVVESNLDGTIQFGSSCNSSRRSRLQRAMNLAVSLVQGTRRDEMLTCLRDSVVALDQGSFPERVMSQLAESSPPATPTFLDCSLSPTSPENAAGALDVVNEGVNFSGPFLDSPCVEGAGGLRAGACPNPGSQSSNDTLVAAVLLHEIAHNKGYWHPSVGPNFFWDTEDMTMWPEVVEHCAEAVLWNWSTGAPTGTHFLTRGWPRVWMRPRTLLAPIGGEGGTAFGYDQCPGSDAARGLRLHANNTVHGMRLRCGSKNGGGTTSQTTLRGTTGGSTETLNCGGSWLMVGVSGFADDEIRGLRPLCESISNISAGVRRSTFNTAPFNPPVAGVEFMSACPAGQVVKAIKGRAGSRIDRIQLVCQKWGSSRTMYDRTGTATGRFDGHTQREICPNGGAMAGLLGRGTGGRIDRLGAMCIGVDIDQTTGVFGLPDAMIPPHGGFGGDLWQNEACFGGSSAMVGIDAYHYDPTGELIGIRGVCASDVFAWRVGAATLDPLPQHGWLWGDGYRRYMCPPAEFVNGWKISTSDADGSGRVIGVQPTCEAL